jgi:hypothetical protein
MPDRERNLQGACDPGKLTPKMTYYATPLKTPLDLPGPAQPPRTLDQ